MGAAIAIPALIAATGVGFQVQQASQQRRAQGRAFQAQERATRQASSQAAAEQRRQEMERRRMNRRAPDLGSILGREQLAGMTGPGSTMLTGAGGVGRERLMLGRSSLLGAT